MKILIIFTLLMFLFYWVQNLVNAKWVWLSFMQGLLDFLTDIGGSIVSGSFNIFGSICEYKYVATLVILGLIYLIAHLGYLAICHVEEIYCSGRKMVRKIEENIFNKQMEIQNTLEAKKITQYQIYLATEIKPELMNRNSKIDINEQNQILLKHLIKQTNQCPEKYQDGHLFTFSNFDTIDEILNIFIKLHQSQAPLNYFICVQIISNNRKNDIKQLDTLIKLRNPNKIITLSDTVYRYQFNKMQNFTTIQTGVFQNENDSYEVHYFANKE